MLQQGNFKQSGTKPSPVVWGDYEWNLIAAELKRRHPLAAWKNFQALDFGIDDFDEAMEAVIGQGRQKSFDSFSEVKGPLYDAHERLKSRKSTSIEVKNLEVLAMPRKKNWDDEEWLAVTVELHRLYPEIFADRLAKLHIPQMREAQQVLGQDRQRNFVQIEIFRKPALRVWDEMQAHIEKKNAPKKPTERPIIHAKPAPIVELAPKKVDESNAMAVAMQTAFQAPVEEKRQQKRVRWDDEDLLKMAREMQRQNPHAGYFTSNFYDFDLDAIRSAQRNVLAKERHRSLHQKYGLAPLMLRAFRLLSDELKKEDAAQETKQEVAELEGKKVAVGEEVISIKTANAVMEDIRNLSTSRPEILHVPGDLTARLTQAAMPLLNVLIGEFAKHLAPEIIKAFTPMMEQAVKDIKSAAARTFVREPLIAAPSQAQAAMTNYAGFQTVFKEVIAEKPKKPKIAALINHMISRDQLERAFPQYEFLFIENGKGFTEASTSCELFLASNVCLTETNRALVNKHIAKDKFKVVDGGISNMKRQINIWEAQKKAN